MEVMVHSGTIRQGEDGITFSFDGCVVVDETAYFAEAYGDESLRGIEYKLWRKRGTGEEIERIEVGPAMPNLGTWERELVELLDEKFEGLGILGSEVLSRRADTPYTAEDIEEEVFSVRMGRVVGGHVVPVIGGKADTFGPVWAR